jgi:hypothetical protein
LFLIQSRGLFFQLQLNDAIAHRLQRTVSSQFGFVLTTHALSQLIQFVARISQHRFLLAASL